MKVPDALRPQLVLAGCWWNGSRSSRRRRNGRAYAEINDFEEQLARNGGILVKYLAADLEGEQYRHFKSAKATRHQQFKITAEDWRNRSAGYSTRRRPAR